MSIKQKDNIILDIKEQKIEKALQRGEYKNAGEFKNTKTMFQEAASNYKKLRLSKSITIRVNQIDLLKVRAKAKKSRLPYQSLLRLLIHQFAEGRAKISL